MISDNSPVTLKPFEYDVFRIGAKKCHVYVSVESENQFNLYLIEEHKINKTDKNSIVKEQDCLFCANETKECCHVFYSEKDAVFFVQNINEYNIEVKILIYGN